LADAIAAYTNLELLRFAPTVITSFQLFGPPLGLDVLSRPHLRSLELNSVAIEGSLKEKLSDEDSTSQLSQIIGLRRLVLPSPNRATLQTLPRWLEKLSLNLSELHLKVVNNCA
jgi:hypothetical protein